MKIWEIEINGETFNVRARKPGPAIHRSIARYLERHPRMRIFNIRIENVEKW